MVTFMMKVVGSRASPSILFKGFIFGFCLASSKGFKWFKRFKRFNGIFLTTVFLFPLHFSSSQYHIPMSFTRTRNIYIR